jgi:hypothetical protein
MHLYGVGWVALGLVAAVSLVGLIYFLVDPPRPNTFAFEVAKAAVQILVVAVIGTVAALLLREFELRRREAAEELSKEEQRRQVRVQFLRTVLDGVLGSYHRVKGIRRRLFADTESSAGGSIDLNTYDDHMHALIEEQLQFEKFKRLAPVLELDKSVTASFEAKSERVEKYLNRVLDEYKENRYRVAEAEGAVPIATLPRLAAFRRGGDFTIVSGGVRSLVEVLETEIQQKSVTRIMDYPDEPTGESLDDDRA